MALVLKIKNKVQEISLKQVLLLAFSIRIAWYLFILFTNPEGFWLYDSNGYWNIAYNLKEYGVFSQGSDSYVNEPLLPDYFRTPLFPLLIYPTVFFDSSGCSVPVINILFDCLTCFLIYKTILRITKNENYAKGGSLIYAIHIPAVLFSNFVLSETVFACLILLFVYLFFKLVAIPGWKNALLCGLAGGLCVMCKPLGFILIFPAALFLLVKQFNAKGAIAILLMTLTFYAVQFPWMQRNKNTFGRYFNSVLGEHLLLGYHTAHVYGKVNHINYFEAKEMLIDKCFEGLNYDPYKHPYEYAKKIEQVAYGVLWENKFIFLKEHGKECMKFFVQPSKAYTNYQLGKHMYTPVFTWTFIAIQLLISGIIFLVIAFAFYKHLQKRIKPGWFIYFLSVVIFLFAQFTTMPYTDSRMRLPVDPLLIILLVVLLHKLAPVKSSYNQRLKSLFLGRKS
ncbi:MAG TPA: glycosyltransferase family 39 protein [Flavobacteriales bacterium]|nr:glycosyltransferase family 39 protein [Flavobacteriales bacterium]